MLVKFILRAAATAAALTCASGPALAENYDVLIMDYAFFPEISYVKAGDTMTFINMSGITRSVETRDNSWATTEIIDGASVTVSVVAEMTNTFITRLDGVGGNGINDGGAGGADVNVDQVVDTELTGQDAEEGTIIGRLSFGNAPNTPAND